MRLEDVMACDPPPLRSGQTIREAAQRMDAGRCNVLPVCEDEQLVGVLTEHEITRAVAAGDDAGSIPVREVMTRDIPAAPPDATLMEAASLMGEGRVRYLCVHEGGRYRGIVYLDVEWSELGDGIPVPTARIGGYPG